jgi:Helix-turn-helix domain
MGRAPPQPQISRRFVATTASKRHTGLKRRGVADQEATELTMPQVVIDGVTIEADRLMLLPAEVALVLRVDEKDVRNMIRRGELRDVSSDGRRRLDPNEVIDVVEKRVAKGELSPHVFVELAALIAGRL